LGQRFQASIVWLILRGETEKALQMLASHYSVSAPRIKVGLPKGYKRKTIGCYNAKNRTISVLNSDTLREPLIILHEFYHHLRTDTGARHRGTEKLAGKFAQEFVHAYESIATASRNN
jgi:hypothetical protein